MTPENMRLLERDYILGDNLTPDKESAAFIAYTNDPDVSYILKELDGHSVQVYQRLTTLSNPFVAKVYEVKKYGTAYIAIMEFVYGKTLTEYVDHEGTLPENQSLELCVELADALIGIHQAGIIHKDITPNNLMITDEGSLKVIDFGIARIPDDIGSNDTTILGTRGFTAPEVRSDIPSSYTADIYSTGCVLNFMLTGQDPGLKRYQGKKGIEMLLKGTLAIDPDNRYQTAGQLKAALKREKALLKHKYRPDLVIFPYRKRNRQFTKLYWILSVALLILCGCVFAMYLYRDNTASATDITPKNDNVVPERSAETEIAAGREAVPVTEKEVESVTDKEFEPANELNSYKQIYPAPEEEELHYNAAGYLTDEDEIRKVFLYDVQPPDDRPFLEPVNDEYIPVSVLGTDYQEGSECLNGTYVSVTDKNKSCDISLETGLSELKQEYRYVGLIESESIPLYSCFLFLSGEGANVPEIYTHGYDLDFFYQENGMPAFSLINWDTGEVVDTYRHE